jgi:hypothetical protein
MVITGLLLIAALCLAIGLMLQSAVWLIASLIATAGAGFLLYKLRDVITAPSGTAGRLPTGGDPRSNGPSTEARPTAAGDTQSAHQLSDVLPVGTDDVWVIDGRPRYHLEGCAIIKGQDAEPIPYEQATEDGFMPCSLCEPDVTQRPG